MTKKIFAVLTAIIFTGTIQNSVFSQTQPESIKYHQEIERLKEIITKNCMKLKNAGVQNDIENSLLSVNTEKIKLSVTPDGIIKRDMYNDISEMDYNSEYNCNVKFLKLINWNGNFAALIADNSSGKKSVITSPLGFIWQPLEYNYFAQSDIPYDYKTEFNINDMAVYGDQLYIACDDGIMLVIPPCVKCYMLKKISENDLKSISFDGDTVILNENTPYYSKLNITDIRQNNISAEEALNMRGSGALLIDVRDENEFNEYHYSDSLNIPLSKISKISEYKKDTVIIFFCKSGARAEKALKEAQKMGFINVYNLGSVDALIN